MSVHSYIPEVPDAAFVNTSAELCVPDYADSVSKKVEGFVWYNFIYPRPHEEEGMEEYDGVWVQGKTFLIWYPKDGNYEWVEDIQTFFGPICIPRVSDVDDETYCDMLSDYIRHSTNIYPYIIEWNDSYTPNDREVGYTFNYWNISSSIYAFIEESRDVPKILRCLEKKGKGFKHYRRFQESLYDFFMNVFLELLFMHFRWEQNVFSGISIEDFRACIDKLEKYWIVSWEYAEKLQYIFQNLPRVKTCSEMPTYLQISTKQYWTFEFFNRIDYFYFLVYLSVDGVNSMK